MRIFCLRSENIKGVKVIEITPKEDMVIISGGNGAGKTSALDSLWYAIEWRAGAKGTPMPIRKGEKFAEINLVLCEDLTEEEKKQGKIPKPLFIVNRRWTANDKTRLKITNPEGLVYETPQKLLDDFIGYLSFDPREFARMNGQEQRDLLIKITGFDVSGIEEKITDLKEERRKQGQKVKLLSGEREEITIENLPEREILTSKINEELEKAINHNQEIRGTKEKIEREEDQVTKAGIRVRNLQAEIANLEEAIKDTKSNIDKEEEYLEGNEIIDTSLIKGRIEEAQKINLQIMARERNKEADKRQKGAQEVWDKQTGRLKEYATEMEDGLKKSWSKIPDQKLSLTEQGIAYDGTPFSQIASSEQLRASMRIAMALNEKLRVIRIADYTLLDEKSKGIVKQMAKDENYQVFAEVVDRTGEVGFYMEEGEITKVDGEKVSQPKPTKGIEGKGEKGGIKGEPKDYERRLTEEE